MTDEQRNELVRMVLKEYFEHRHPTENMFERRIREWKTTEDIMDDLLPIMEIRADEVLMYLKDFGYTLFTRQDGSMCWLLWRDLPGDEPEVNRIDVIQ